MHYFISGGAGFIGSHLTERLLLREGHRVTVFDNFCSGTRGHLAQVEGHERLLVLDHDLKNLADLTAAMAGADVVIHLASNPDIAKAATQPDIDFWEGTYLTQNVLEAMRVNGVKQMLYTSGSGVYGEVGETAVAETYSPMLPISTYAASKLAGEALICAYCHLFEIRAFAFRFANVVGPRQTHGVGYDFVRKLRRDPSRLVILGDGRQSKSYIHVDDVIEAMFHVAQHGTGPFDVFNVATGDYITVKEIADLAVAELGLDGKVQYEFTGGDRGWKGDVPVVRFDLEKIHRMGWRAERGCEGALRASLQAMILETAPKEA